MAQARATRFSRQPGQRFDSLSALGQAAEIARTLNLPPEWFDRIRDAAIASLALADLKPTGHVIREPPETLFFCFDPGMRRYALRLQSGTILVRQVADDQEVSRFQAQGDRNVFVFAFSPDGRYLMTTHSPGDALTVWDVDANARALDDAGPVDAAGFTPDSRQIALAHRDGEVVSYDLDIRRRRPLRSGLGRVRRLAYRADGHQIAVRTIESGQHKCHVLDVESGRTVRTLPLSDGAAIAWSPDGATLATDGADFTIDLWDVASGMKRARLEGSMNGGLMTSFHPSGTLLASNGWEDQLRLWDAVLGRPLLNVIGGSHLPGALAFSRDGQIVVSSEGRLTAYQAEPALEYRALVNVASGRTNYQRPAIRHDNRLLAVGSDRGVFLWDLERGTECGFLPIARAWHVVFEASGDLLTSGSVGALAMASPARLGPR